jgi:hypothetical protein
MLNSVNKLAAVIPTVGRPMELRRMGKSWAEPSAAPDRVQLRRKLSDGMFARSS